MFPYNIFRKFLGLALLINLAMSSLAQAQESNGENILPVGSLGLTTVSLSYVSWLEFVDLDNGTLTDHAYANFYGNALTVEREIYSGRKGFAFDLSFLIGQANAGGTQNIVSYQASYQKWWGGMASARYAYRLSPQIAISLGPMALSRQVTWPDQGANVSIKSGADFNLGILADLCMRLVREWEMKMTVGTLAFKASTLWSLGVGYKF